MEKQNYIWINGEFTRNDQPVLNIHNRSFAYGDGFFETIHSYGTEPMYLELHLTRIYRSLSILGMEQPSFLTKEFLAKEITRLLNKNRIFGSARIRITIFRNEGGLYTPSDNRISLVIQSAIIPQNFYPLNPKGLVVDLYSEIRKPINILSSIKSCNALIYVMAGQYKQQQKLDDCLLINDQNRIIEAISSNIFVVKGNIILTPSIEEGCVAGVMRKVVIDLAKRNGFKVIDNAVIEADKLLEADEVFLTNAISGIQWVVGLRHKRYFGIVSKKLSLELNKETFSNQFKDGFSG
jgi:branched-chain amino acid aminotransferase